MLECHSNPIIETCTGIGVAGAGKITDVKDFDWLGENSPNWQVIESKTREDIMKKLANIAVENWVDTITSILTLCN